MDRTKHIVVLILISGFIIGPLAAAVGPSGPRGRAGADLSVRPGSYASDPPEPRVGDQVKSNVTIENLGDADVSGNFTVAFFLNDTATPLKPVESNVTFGYMAAGESFAVEITWSSSGLASGINYTILVIIDFYNEVAESDESNNQLAQNLSLLPRLYPDFALSPDELRLSPPVPMAGDIVTVTATVRNLGELDARYVDLFFYINDTDHPVGSLITIKGLNSSEQKNASKSWDTAGLPPGIYILLLFINPPWSANFEAELNNANNNLTLPVTLGERQPDLYIDNATWLPAKPKVGQSLVVSAELANAGNGASAPCNLSLFIDYDFTPAATASVPAILPDGRATVMLGWNTTGASSGIHRARLLIDPDDELGESNRTNNGFTWMVELLGEVDLSLENLSISPASAMPGDNVTFSVKVANRGSLRCNSANLTLQVGGLAADHQLLMRLAAGGHLNATLKWTTANLSAGNYDYELVVTPGPADTDSEPANNHLQGQLELLRPPPVADLRIASINYLEPTVRVGDQLTLLIVVENAGTLDAPNSNLSVLLSSSSGRLLRFTDATIAVPSIPAGQGVTVSVHGDTSRFQNGTYTLNVTADYSNDVAESNEANNYLERQLVILPPPQKRPALKIDDIFYAGKRQADERIDIIVGINNTGDAAAMDVVVSFIIDGKVAGTQNIDQIAPGTIRNATLSWTFGAGQHTVKVTVSAMDVQNVTAQAPSLDITTTPWVDPAYLVAGGLAILILLFAIVLARSYSSARKPGPKVKLVEEEE